MQINTWNRAPNLTCYHTKYDTVFNHHGPYAPARYRGGKFKKNEVGGPTPYAPRGDKYHMGVNLANCGGKFIPTRDQG